ncbi:nuclear transport factor 2 family protein [Nocardia sp. NPDC058658]|uniref:nuclear transport factor 2 family protein n=1 Tax=Nocardia sp. NPDC058658 TaxID=3346580 RepID=UPI00364652CC
MTTTAVTADQLAADWTELWNTDPDIAHRLLADDFRLRFASEQTRESTDPLRGPAELAAFVTGFRAQRPGVRFVVDSAAVGTLDAAGTGMFAVRWHSEDAGVPAHGGIDLFDAVGGRLRQIWSVGGTAPFALD